MTQESLGDYKQPGLGGTSRIHLGCLTRKPVLLPLHPPTAPLKEGSPQFALFLESSTALGKCWSSDINTRSQIQFCKRFTFLSFPMNQNYFVFALLLLFGRNLTSVNSRCPQFGVPPMPEIACKSWEVDECHNWLLWVRGDLCPISWDHKIVAMSCRV